MENLELCIKIDGRVMFINQAGQEVRVLNESGRVVLHERIQVAAGSLQGYFSMLEDAGKILGVGDPRFMA